LDLAAITEVRIGWGGYIGTEREKVEFTVALPQTAVAKAAPHTHLPAAQAGQLR
jgi:hypothetical protein